MTESRLERMIERFTTQRACLNYAARLITSLPGPVIELGLGKGRTYDHLRQLLPAREIFAYDREVHALKDCIPDSRHLILGDFQDTLPRAVERLGGSVALLHADIGSENRQADKALVSALVPFIDVLVKPGALVLGDRPMELPRERSGEPPGEMSRWRALPLPEGVGRWPYFLYQIGVGLAQKSSACPAKIPASQSSPRIQSPD